MDRNHKYATGHGLKAYLNKHQMYPSRIHDAPHSNLRLIVVIPCHDEPKVLSALESLWRCARTNYPAEVIIVINASEAHPVDVVQRNEQTLREVSEWICGHPDRMLVFHVLYYPRLPAKHAGVGLARKLGMDEAVARFCQTARKDGVIVGFDADCGCAEDYLTQIETHFDAHPRSPGCAIHFEHPLCGDRDQRVYEGIAHYELYLRYYLLGLRYARFPHAFHTVGSSMAVRAWAYANQGGMNRRQAGEDFYFLNKIIALGEFTELRSTMVAPSPRVSHRVPFGTGRAMTEWLAGENRYRAVFSPNLFHELRVFFERVPDWFENTGSPMSLLSGLPTGISTYLVEQGFESKIREIRANVSRVDTFWSRFFRWFDAFRLFKFLRWSDSFSVRSEPLSGAVITLLRWQQAQGGACGETVLDLLQHLRDIDREGRFSPTSIPCSRLSL